MKLAWASDLHLDHCDEATVSRFLADVNGAGADALVLAGDLAQGDSIVPWLDRIERSVPRLPIHFVLGNHDYYRSSLAAVRREMSAFANRRVRYLSLAGVVALDPHVGLVGVDGWGDARAGRGWRSPVLLNDFFQIDELAAVRSSETRGELLAQRGTDEAERLRPNLELALARFPHVIVATHVPPFREACWHEGRLSDDDFSPHFTCVAVGDAIRQAAEAHPDRRIMVLCGHTHGEGTATVMPNVVVHTAGSDYGRPRLESLLHLG
jgi:predicted MPP superfamily phosphohydrolase